MNYLIFNLHKELFKLMKLFLETLFEPRKMLFKVRPLTHLARLQQQICKNKSTASSIGLNFG